MNSQKIIKLCLVLFLLCPILGNADEIALFNPEGMWVGSSYREKDLIYIPENHLRTYRKISDDVFTVSEISYDKLFFAKDNFNKSIPKEIQPQLSLGDIAESHVIRWVLGYEYFALLCTNIPGKASYYLEMYGENPKFWAVYKADAPKNFLDVKYQRVSSKRPFRNGDDYKTSYTLIGDNALLTCFSFRRKSYPILFYKYNKKADVEFFNEFKEKALFLYLSAPEEYPHKYSDKKIEEYCRRYADALKSKTSEDYKTLSLARDYMKFAERFAGRWQCEAADSKKYEAAAFLNARDSVYFFVSPQEENGKTVMKFIKLTLHAENGNQFLEFEKFEINIKDNFLNIEDRIKSKFPIGALNKAPIAFENENFKLEISGDFTEIREYRKDGEEWVLLSVMKKAVGGEKEGEKK